MSQTRRLAVFAALGMAVLFYRVSVYLPSETIGQDVLLEVERLMQRQQPNQDSQSTKYIKQDILELKQLLQPRQPNQDSAQQAKVPESAVPSGEDLNEMADDDPRLIAYIRQHVMEPPSPLPYNLTNPNKTHYSQFGQDKLMDDMLQQMENGFFVEVGANSGELLSNSLFFERERHWTGLLIEADPIPYSELRTKHRKAHHLNACLSLTTKPSSVHFRQNNYLGRIDASGKTGVRVQCFPLYSLMLALGKKRIDYFSLDIEGDEPKVLRTIPWDKMEVRVLDVEVNKIGGRGGTKLIEYMASVGYTFIRKHGIDMVFAKTSLLGDLEIKS